MIKITFFLTRLSILLVSGVIVGCANTAVDKPLKHWTPQMAEQTTAQMEGNRSPEITVLLGFSGGGTRASAFAYGVLKELSETNITLNQKSHTLLSEVDIISSVSGGSFTAAYYGLHGDKIFDDFEERFLRKDVEAILFEKMFNPVNWFKLMSQEYGRSDLAAEYYDKDLFDGATLSALDNPQTPLIIMNSTDLATGDRFPFERTAYDLICADYNAYPLARAVAASSAVPVILSPITLENYAGSCDYQPPAWQAQALKSPVMSESKIEALKFQEYMDVKKRPWLHLVDGGISDNLGLRAYYDALNIFSGPGFSSPSMIKARARHIIIISVNAHARHKSDWMLERYAPSMFEMLGSVSADEINRYSDDTIELIRYSFDTWVAKESTPDDSVTFHFVEVSFDKVTDDKEREFLNEIGTNFDLSDEQVDRLIAAAKKILEESGEFSDFLNVVNQSSSIAESTAN